MTPDRLAAVRARIPDCALAIWADMETSTVLAGDADLHYPQEHLDALGDCAAMLLGLPGLGDGPQPDDAIFLGPTGSYGFLRIPGAAGEALCCLCGPMLDPDALIQAIRQAVASSELAGDVHP
jgi:hypothetical protein